MFLGALGVKISDRRLNRSLACLLLLGGCSNEGDNAKSFFDEKIACPPPAVAEFEGWGKAGKQLICKIKHGPIIAWEDGYIHFRGQFENGKEVGVWYWYDRQGNVIESVDHSSRAQR